MPNATIGRNLETDASIRLAHPAPAEGLELTVTSSNPQRLLLSRKFDQAGAASLTLKVAAGSLVSPGFWLQAMGDKGTVAYTVSAAGVGKFKGTVTLARSSIVIVGPHKASKFSTTPRGMASKIVIASVMLEPSGKIAMEQTVAGGSKLEVSIANSNPGAGKLESSKFTLNPGDTTAFTRFLPAAEGETVLSPVQPAGCVAAAEKSSLTATVAKAGLRIVGDIYVGKNLETDASLALGEPAPPGGLEVKLTSSDPSKLVLSAAADKPGAGSITLSIPENQWTAEYFIQALGDSGEVTYEASAPGFRASQARVGLTPSGMIVAYQAYGNQKDGEVKRKIGAAAPQQFPVSLADAEKHPQVLVVYAAYIDPRTGRAADSTIQPLRAGLDAKIVMESSQPEVAKIESPLVMKAGANHVIAKFMPLSSGTTILTLNTPEGFATPKNSAPVPAVVSK